MDKQSKQSISQQYRQAKLESNTIAMDQYINSLFQVDSITHTRQLILTCYRNAERNAGTKQSSINDRRK